MKKLFDEVKMNRLTVKNRLVRSATWEGIADPYGNIDERSYKIYEELARGGVGLIIGGFTSVADNDFYFDGMMRLSNNSLIPQYKKLTDLVHKYDCKIIAQLALGAFYRNGAQIEPDYMTADEIKTVIQQFAEAAERAEKAGFDGVQIHAAHFFFLSRFISPRVNHRTDIYGGNTDNRMRILLEIMDGIREVCPDLHITIKINSSDFTFGGLEQDESLYISKRLSAFGIDSIEVSGNGTSVGGIKAHVNEAYFLDFAAKLADEVQTPIILVGGLRAKDTMEDVLNTTKIELLSLSRPLLREPDFPNRLRDEENAVSKCVSCNRCYSSDCHKCVFRR
ncbi:NADH:flavin oxidoreductase [Ruminococcus sp.]|uniref:NADH:flavin oxidoreductase n=1 Tax=Ruminococcus sp. TaxID=41978 RepID=UPI003890982F